MAARLHFVRGPDPIALQTELLRRVVAQACVNPGSVLCLAPSSLAVDSLQTPLLELAGVVLGVRLMSLPALVAEVLQEDPTPQRQLSSAQRRLLLEEILADLLNTGQLSYFANVAQTPGFASLAQNLMDELRDNGISVSALARAAYRFEPSVARLVYRTGQFTISCKHREWIRLYARYQRELARLGCESSENQLRRILRLLPHSLAPSLQGIRQVVVIGFSDMLPQQVSVLRSLAERCDSLTIGCLAETDTNRKELFEATDRLTSSFADWPVTVADCSESSVRPAGLEHLQRQLFRPLWKIEQASQAEGVRCIEAAGAAGEARLVARAIKQLLLSGVLVDQIDVVLREVAVQAELLREVFASYALGVRIDTPRTVDRCPAVGLLLRAARLPEEGFPFAGVTALLRHGYFRPAWVEEEQRQNLPLLSEALLRLLGESRGQDAYLKAVARWAEREQPGLEDETADQSRRTQIHELAKLCQPFLERFFAMWSSAPLGGRLEQHLDWLDQFAAELGLVEAARDDPLDAAGWQALQQELTTWRARAAQMWLDRRSFLHRLTAMVSCVTFLPPESETLAIRVLSAEQAQHRTSDYRFLMGLGERAFPRLAAQASLLTAADRQAFRSAGIPLTAERSLSEEMLLFYRLVCGTRQQLVLSYVAVDERGQKLLPASFLLNVRDCFKEGVIPTERRTMPLERHESDKPLSPAEYRVQVAAVWPNGSSQCPDELRSYLSDAAFVMRQRLGSTEFTSHDGMLSDPLYTSWTAKLFGNERVFSPTALEEYIACPFRFFVRHVLHLEPLEEPTEQIEVTRRGMTVHRALARLHHRLQQQGIHEPSEQLAVQVQEELQAAVEEDARRSPGPAAEILWYLEGQRLLRDAGRYPEQWKRFVQTCLEKGIQPRPEFFEIDFGLPGQEGRVAPPLVLKLDDIQIHLWGRIDRVDIAELPEGTGFWIIDYKTGHGSNYTSTDLAKLRKLQLPIYALAVESVLLADRKARPLGLAYWLVGEAGAKVVLPARGEPSWIEDAERWPAFRQRLLQWIGSLVRNIRKGAFPLAPLSEDCMQSCPFGQMCRITQGRRVGKVWDLTPASQQEGTP